MINHPNRKKATQRKTSESIAPTHNHDHDYSALLIGVNRSFDILVNEHKVFFLTDAEGLWDLYLDNLPAERQVHNCQCCRSFIGRYGKIVAIGDNGELLPAMWNPNAVPEFYRKAFAAMYSRVRCARVTSVFLSKNAVWGTPITGEWSHMSVPAPLHLIYRERALTAGQAMAATKENYRTVAAALADFTTPMLDEALRLLQAEALAHSEKFIGPTKWLRELQARPKGRLGENVLWRAIATAPEGFCHPRASVIGPLMEDIRAGMSFAEIKARFNAKMHPLIYQRPQAAPTVANIKAAEDLVNKLGIGRSLERRFARLDECCVIWSPTIPREVAPAGGVFGHLRAKNVNGEIQPVAMPPVRMTWEKFRRNILGSAEELEIAVPITGRFLALTTAAHADAPPILKWDRDDARNPVAWYVYPNGSPARQWKLEPCTWAKVNAIVPLPTLWGSQPMPFIDEGAVLVIDGAADQQSGQGNALFPGCLREELHGVRATIEAYSKKAELVGREQASACGYDIRKSAADCVLRVLAKGARTSYQIDRWD